MRQRSSCLSPSGEVATDGGLHGRQVERLGDERIRIMQLDGLSESGTHDDDPRVTGDSLSEFELSLTDQPDHCLKNGRF